MKVKFYLGHENYWYSSTNQLRTRNSWTVFDRMAEPSEVGCHCSYIGNVFNFDYGCHIHPVLLTDAQRKHIRKQHSKDRSGPMVTFDI